MVGEDVGGLLAYWVAATAPDLASKIVSISGYPTPGVGTDDFDKPLDVRAVRRDAEKECAKFAHLKGPAFVSAMEDVLGEYWPELVDMDRTVARSSPKAVGEYLYEMRIADLRRQAATLKVPVLLVCPYNTETNAPQEFAARWFERVGHMIPNHRVMAYALCGEVNVLQGHSPLLSDMDTFLRSGVRGLIAPPVRPPA